MKRTFIGLKINSNPVLDRLLSDLKRDLSSENLRWIDPDNLHLTLRFLGDTEDAQLSSIYSELELLIPQYDHFNLDIEGLGLFGKQSAPKILWAGVKIPSKVYELVAGIEEIVCKAGFAAEIRPYSPHLTLCRIKSVSDPYHLAHLTGQYKQTHFLTQEISQVIMYESVLKSFGAVYVPLRIFNLNDRVKK
jgi:RNA 2',3'-cyclic 3'-phosphodiesterase